MLLDHRLCLVGHDGRRPQAFEALLEAQWLEHVVGAGLEAFAAADAGLQELLLGQAARRPDGQRRRLAGQIGAPELRRRCERARADRGRRRTGRQREEAAAAQRRFVRRRVVLDLEGDRVPPLDELDRVLSAAALEPSS